MTSQTRPGAVAKIRRKIILQGTFPEKNASSASGSRPSIKGIWRLLIGLGEMRGTRSRLVARERVYRDDDDRYNRPVQEARERERRRDDDDRQYDEPSPQRYDEPSPSEGPPVELRRSETL